MRNFPQESACILTARRLSPAHEGLHTFVWRRGADGEPHGRRRHGLEGAPLDMALRVRLQHPKGECRASLLTIMQAAPLQQAVINFRSNALMRHLSVRLQRHCSRREVAMHWSGALMRCLHRHDAWRHRGSFRRVFRLR